MPTKHQLRSAKVLANAKRQRTKYPEFLRQLVEMSDIILEILDARFIDETRNKEIEQSIKKKDKKILYVLNKSDLINKDKLDKSKLDEIKPYVFVSATKRNGGRELRDKIKRLSKTIVRVKDSERVSVGVIGYPNTGKSSVINLLIGRSSAKTGATAGFTKGIQKLRLSSDIVLIDSPGVIPESRYSNIDQNKISSHVLVGARDYYKIKEPELAVSYIFNKHKDSFEQFYKMQFNDSEDLIEKIGKKKNILQKGGSINSDQAARTILKDWQQGRIQI